MLTAVATTRGRRVEKSFAHSPVREISQRRLLRSVSQSHNPFTIELALLSKFRGGGNVAFTQAIEICLFVDEDGTVISFGEQVFLELRGKLLFFVFEYALGIFIGFG